MQLGVVLEGFSDSVIVAVTDPRTGLQRRAKWLPTIAEVVEACEAEANAQATRARYDAMPKPRRIERIIDRSPGRRANVCVYRDAPQYPAMFERTQSPDADPADWKMDEGGNLWVSLAWFDVLGIGKWTRPKFRPDNDTKIEAEEMRDDIDIQEEVSCTES